MAMTFSLHDSIDPSGAFDRIDTGGSQIGAAWEARRNSIHLIRERLEIPEHDNLVERPRLDALLDRSRAQYPATLISGRSGTGKTALAASYASRSENAAWLSVESTDIDWPVFARYFAAAVCERSSGRRRTIDENNSLVSGNEIARFLVNVFSDSYGNPAPGPRLIVLDDIHHLFDAPWFDDFFNLLLYSLPPQVHLLLLCRSKPPGPLWRLRSKQMLNVLDEKVIAFTISETQKLFESLDIVGDGLENAHRASFGRISRLLQAVAG
jgi:ATP/maltotriose-dependent transcriptional regulator MalT